MEIKNGKLVLVSTYKSNNVLDNKNCIWKQNHTGKLYFFDILTSDSEMNLYTPFHLSVINDEPLIKSIGVNYYFNTYDNRFWQYSPAPCPLPWWGNLETLREILVTTDEKVNLPISTDFVKKFCKLYNEGAELNDFICTFNEAKNVSIRVPKTSWSKDELTGIVMKLMHQVHKGEITFGDNMIDFKISPAEWIKQNVSFY